EVDIFNANDQFITSGFSDASGNYISDGGLTTGTYFAVTANSQHFINKVFDNIVCVSCDPVLGTPISVTLPNTMGSINFALSPGGRIAGTITNTSAVALANVGVTIYDAT